MLALRASVLTALFALVAAFSISANAGDVTKADAQAIVEKAIDFAKSNGKDQLISEVNKQNGQFHKGELYVFVYDLTGTLIADPVNPNLVGQNNVEKPDADGKLFRKEIVNVANAQGTGWVDYRFKNPVSGQVEPKSAFVKREGDVIVIAGIYTK